MSRLQDKQSADRADEPLFRHEVLAEHRTRWLGTVLLEPKISHGVFGALAAATTIAVLALLVFGSFTRKERIKGWLVPERGLVRVFAPQSGSVTRIAVREGDHVNKGDVLLGVSTELRSATAGATRQEIVRRLASRRTSMASEAALENSRFDQQAVELKKRIAVLASEQKLLGQELELQRMRVRLAQQVLAKERQLRAKDLITEPRLYRTEQDMLEQVGRLRTLERQQATLVRDKGQVDLTLQELPLQLKTRQGEIERSVAALEQELAEAETRRELVLSAPENGVVSAIQAEPGGTAQTNAPLVTIVPEGTLLQAELFAPGRAIGFLRSGQRVLLRYAAFPYQKFGLYEGSVSGISRAAVSPAELSQPLTGLSSLYAPNEPLYRVTVNLARQQATAYGKEIELQPGMQLEADVLIEKRRLIEWMFEPLFTLTGSWIS